MFCEQCSLFRPTLTQTEGKQHLQTRRSHKGKQGIEITGPWKRQRWPISRVASDTEASYTQIVKCFEQRTVRTTKVVSTIVFGEQRLGFEAQPGKVIRNLRSRVLNVEG